MHAGIAAGEIGWFREQRRLESYANRSIVWTVGHWPRVRAQTTFASAEHLEVRRPRSAPSNNLPKIT